ncbi:MAG TPA: hypothetical protein DHV60_03630 [Verrucomicrobiales bacterium]|nr:hypothetical protein [Verrucomicrobiales bacterium]
MATIVASSILVGGAGSGVGVGIGSGSDITGSGGVGGAGCESFPAVVFCIRSNIFGTASSLKLVLSTLIRL